MSFITEQSKPKKRLVIVKYYLTFDEYANMKEIAAQMCKDGVIPKNHVNVFAKAAGYKFYNEYNEKLKRRLNAHSQ